MHRWQCFFSIDTPSESRQPRKGRLGRLNRPETMSIQTAFNSREQKEI